MGYEPTRTFSSQWGDLVATTVDPRDLQKGDLLAVDSPGGTGINIVVEDMHTNDRGHLIVHRFGKPDDQSGFYTGNERQEFWRIIQTTDTGELGQLVAASLDRG
jgi:hypothetical protein